MSNKNESMIEILKKHNKSLEKWLNYRKKLKQKIRTVQTSVKAYMKIYFKVLNLKQLKILASH
jgi:proline dehydrogenase